MITASIAELSKALADKRLSSVELTDGLLDRIAQHNPALKAFVTIDAERARADAKMADVARADGRAGPLTGIPIAHKDVLMTTGLKTTCGSRMLENFVAPYDAHVVDGLKLAGTVLVGKTNMDEFAMGSSNETSYFGTVKNPWNLAYVPGGSSGGSAA
jgi:aspartyl-tRNA(Asn)/glutamyl-tRNA(Gln) amidotransferase subunit A